MFFFFGSETAQSVLRAKSYLNFVSEFKQEP
jgi:hypothetical protein